MKIQFEEWVKENSIPEDSKNLFFESVSCYRIGAYRSAFIMSYIGFQNILKQRILDILTNKYERNLTARKKCIAVYGTACQICRFDFGAVYGPEFAGKIHVHHKLPLYEIKEDYVVDPVKDLIPVCPNCHMILHSKPGGFYNIEEVKDMIEV